MLPDGEQDGTWWNENLPSTLPDAAWALRREFDAIVIDEAQDMDPAWWDYLKLLLPEPDDGVFSVFADANQDVYRNGWVPPFETIPFPLDRNCRNTVEIADRVMRVMPESAAPIGLTGIAPAFKNAETERQIVKAIEASLRNFLEEGGLHPDQVTILSNRRSDIEFIGGMVHELIDSGADEVEIETVHRFKGLESDAVILLIRDEVDPEEIRRLAYVGMSRARSLLHVIGSSLVRRAIEWDAESSDRRLSQSNRRRGIE